MESQGQSLIMDAIAAILDPPVLMDVNKRASGYDAKRIPRLAGSSVAAATGGEGVCRTIGAPVLILLLPLCSAAVESSANRPIDDEIVELEPIEVLGVRGSLMNAQEIKKSASNLLDSIVAEDLGKLPDNTIADAVRRIPGIQVRGNGWGEVGTIVLRGLPDFATTLNGHEIFTGFGRNVVLTSLPAELVAGVDVYKSTSPDKIEGGIAGLIDTRLRRPFDFEAAAFGASGRVQIGAHASDAGWVGSVIASNRWQLDGGGEFGALLAASSSRESVAEQFVFNGIWNSFPIDDPSLADGNTELHRPESTATSLQRSLRRRVAHNISLQWRPHSDLEIHADFLHLGYRGKPERYGFIGFPGWGTIRAVDLFPGTSIARRVVSTDNTHLTNSLGHSENVHGYQGVVGARWPGRLMTFSTELVYASSRIRARGLALNFLYVGPSTTTFDFTTRNNPNVTVTGGDTTESENYRLGAISFDEQFLALGNQFAWQGKMEREIDGGGFLTRFEAGVRSSRREAGVRHGFRAWIPPPGGPGVIPVDSIPDLGGNAPEGLLSKHRFATSNWYGPDPRILRDSPDTVRAVFGFPAGPPPFDRANAFTHVETNHAIYGQADYEAKLGGTAVKGLFGVRIVKTDQDLENFQNDGTRVEGRRNEIQVLPTLNGRIEPVPDVLLRFSAGRSITRPGFSALNPAVNFTQTGPTDGSGGNPDLEDVKSDNFDVALEYYFAPSGYVSLSGFYRRVDGYIEPFAARETIGDASYVISRPRNTGKGHLEGLEFSYQRMFDSLPAPLDGLGLQANYTYTTGRTDAEDTSLGAPIGARMRRPYAGVSRHAYNAIGIYENGPLSIRLAYNWRGSFVLTFNGPGDPGSPLRVIRVDPIDRLDLSVGYRLRDSLTLTFDATNLLDSSDQEWFGSGNLHQASVRLEDRTFALGMRYSH